MLNEQERFTVAALFAFAERIANKDFWNPEEIQKIRNSAWELVRDTREVAQILCQSEEENS